MRRIVAVGIISALFVVAAAGSASAAGSRRSTHRGAGGSFVPVGTTLNGGSGVVPGGSGTVVRGHRRGRRNTLGRSIEISIAQQRLWAYQNGRVVMTFLVSTGRRGFRTPTGRFHILAKGRNWWSRKWSVWMPNAMNFFSNYNLHSLPYIRPGHLIGASQLGRPMSHGCVRIGPLNARRLYAWTPIGTPLWIH
ncbi:MAG: hypothetical protein NVSMB57_08940 [Actinomycetota bacterium]